MAIQAINDGTEIKEGQWVCGESDLQFGLCAFPRQVLRVAGQRIYTVKRDANDTGIFLLRKTAKFLCDSREEGNKLAQVSQENHDAVTASLNSITASNMTRISSIASAAH